MHFEYDFDPSVEWLPDFPTISPGDYDRDHTNPTSLWTNDCGASRKSCNGNFYYGGHNECGQGNTIHRTFE
jgi:hypothetical protein